MVDREGNGGVGVDREGWGQFCGMVLALLPPTHSCSDVCRCGSEGPIQSL